MRGAGGHLDRDAFYLGVAAAVAAGADCTRRRVGCVLVLDNRIVATGFNGAPAGDASCLAGACPRGLLDYDAVPAGADYGAGAGRCIAIHAEANALLHAGRDCRGATAYITCPPCSDCEKLLRGAGIERTVF